MTYRNRNRLLLVYRTRNDQRFLILKTYWIKWSKSSGVIHVSVDTKCHVKVCEAVFVLKKQQPNNIHSFTTCTWSIYNARKKVLNVYDKKYLDNNCDTHTHVNTHLCLWTGTSSITFLSRIGYASFINFKSIIKLVYRWWSPTKILKC